MEKTSATDTEKRHSILEKGRFLLADYCENYVKYGPKYDQYEANQPIKTSRNWCKRIRYKAGPITRRNEPNY